MDKEKDEEEKKKRKYLIIIFFLIIAVIVSNCLLLGIIASRSKKYTGKVLNTIVLDPNQDEELPLSLCGRLVDQNGKGIKDYTIELHSDPRRDITDNVGDFFFYNVEEGSHTLAALDSNNNEKAKASLKINKQDSKDFKAINLDSKTNSIEITLANNTLVLEFDIQLNEDGTLTILDNSVNALCNDGTMYSLNGSKKINDNEVIISSHGSLLLPDGSVDLHAENAILYNGIYVTEEGKVYYKESEISSNSLPDGYVLLEDKLTLKDGTVIDLSKNKTILKDNTEIKDSTITLPDGTSSTISNVTTTPSGTTFIPSNTITNQDTSNKEEQKVEVIDKRTDTSWAQLSTIQLFDTKEKLHPGSEGSYSFYVKNGRDSQVRYQMNISEENHEAGNIPLEYQIVDNTGKSVLDQDKWLSANEIKQAWVNLNTKGIVNYTLKWRWPYEGHDNQDTTLGNASNSEHKIHVLIYVEEVN